MVLDVLHGITVNFRDHFADYEKVKNFLIFFVSFRSTQELQNSFTCSNKVKMNIISLK